MKGPGLDAGLFSLFHVGWGYMLMGGSKIVCMNM